MIDAIHLLLSASALTALVTGAPIARDSVGAASVPADTGAPTSRPQDHGPAVPGLWNPSDDVQFGAEAKSQLADGLLKLLQGMFKGADFSEESLRAVLNVNEFQCNTLRPALDVRRDERGIRVETAAAKAFGSIEHVEDAKGAFAAFLAPLDDGEDRHVKFKTIRVVPDSDSAFQIEVLLQTSARIGPGARQQNARWSIGFEALEPDAEFRISFIEALEFTEVTFDTVLFEDATARALAGAGGSSIVLEKGSEHWHSRIDNLGEANYFGHNGIAVGDVNGDDLDDLYVAQGTGLPNLLFVQQPNGDFVELGEHSGAAWLDDTKGVLLADYDNDGDRDLIACIGPLIILSSNDGTGVFTPARQLGSESTSSFYSLSAADYDLDGDLDIFAVRYVKTSYGDSVPIQFHDARNGPKNHLMRNDGEAGFVDVSAQVGLDVNNDRFSLASAWSDYDNDGDPDLYVANDFGRNNLYRNDGGTFVDVAAETGCEDQAAGMGVSWADVDLDGRFDMLVSNMFSSAGRRIAYQTTFKSGENEEDRHAIQRHALGNSLFVNAGDAGFDDVSESAGLRMGRWSWGARFSDLDMDGLPDVVVPNGFLTGDEKDDL